MRRRRAQLSLMGGRSVLDRDRTLLTEPSVFGQSESLMFFRTEGGTVAEDVRNPCLESLDTPVCFMSETPLFQYVGIPIATSINHYTPPSMSLWLCAKKMSFQPTN